MIVPVYYLTKLVFGLSDEDLCCVLQDNNVERAVDWIFSHTDELDTPMETEAGGDTVPNTTYRDGEGSKYLTREGKKCHTGAGIKCYTGKGQ